MSDTSKKTKKTSKSQQPKDLGQQVTDFYCCSPMPLLWVCFFQSVAIGWVFGPLRFCDCVEQMTGHNPWYWIPNFCLAPVVMGGLFIFYCVQYTPVR